MRNAFGAMGLLCGAIVVALVARYGFKTTDVEFDAWIMAFMFGVIATFGLAGHAFAVFLWRYSRPISIIAGIVAVIALGLNLSNSLGAIAGRSDVVQTERVEKNRKIRAAETELKRLTGLRDAMPDFDYTDADAVAAARRASEAASKSREAECTGRGKFCRDREADERAANAALSKATASKAATDRATKLEADAADQKKLLNSLGPIVVVNVQGAEIAKLFRLPDDEAGFAASLQQFGIAAVVELIILICLIGWEASRPNVSTPQTLPANVSTKRENVDISEPETPAAITPVIPAPSKPKLVAVSPTPMGNVNRILTDNLEAAAGERVELADIARRYREVCKGQGRKPVTQDEFVRGVETFCRAIGIKRHNEDGHLYLLDVQLSENKTVMAVDTNA